MHTRAVLLVFTLAFIFMGPAAAEAQWLRVGFASGWPGFWYQRPWGPAYPYAPYPPDWRYAESVAVRLDIEPNEAEVFVNGYFAGTVDDYDGIFQRLRLRPGEHEITIHLDGYRTIRERRYFNPNAVLTIRRSMTPLIPGELQQPPPQPVESPATPARVDPPRPAPAPRPRPERRGTLSLRVDSTDVEIVVDGERRTLDPGKTVLTLPLSPGRHKVEVRREGYQTYSEDVLIRPEATMNLAVTLVKR